MRTGQDRTRGIMQHLGRHRAQQESPERSVPVGRHDNQVKVPVVGIIDDLLGGIAFFDYPGDRDAFETLGGKAVQFCFALLKSLVADFGIFRNGRLAFVEVQSSSGLPIYDQSAVDSIRLASPFAPLPPPLIERMAPSSTGVPIRARFHYILETGLQ